MKKSKTSSPGRNKWVFAAAGAICLAATVLSLCLGAAKLPLSKIWQAALAGPDSAAGAIFWYVRLPRTLGCLLAGAALALSGAVIQGVLDNPLASPGIIGVNAGAGLAVTLCCALGLLSGWAIAGAAFGGAMLAVGMVTFAAEKTGASRTTVILGGVAVNSFLNALAEALRNLVPETATLSSDFRVGGFDAVSYTRLIPAGVLILLATAAVLTLCSELDVLALGENTAQGLGLGVKRTRLVLLLLSALLAGSAVSYAGLVGFVGLIVPHAARAMIGSESRKLLPLCALGGAGFVTVCDLAARLLFAPYELPAGILLSVLGGPFFLYLLSKRRGGRRND